MAQHKQKTIAAHPGGFYARNSWSRWELPRINWRRPCTFRESTRLCVSSERSAPMLRSAWASILEMTPQFWMNLQTDYDLRRAAASAALNRIKPRSAA